MTLRDYIQNALRTESTIEGTLDLRSKRGRLLHAAIGLCTESGELLDALKKNLYYGKPLDETNMKEEGGDLFWYLAILIDALGIEGEEVLATNIAKLRVRYPHRFESDQAISRDLVAERKILEEATPYQAPPPGSYHPTTEQLTNAERN